MESREIPSCAQTVSRLPVANSQTGWRGLSLLFLVAGAVGCWCSPVPSTSQSAIRVADALEHGSLDDLNRQLVDEGGQELEVAGIERGLWLARRDSALRLRSAVQSADAERVAATYRLADGSIVVLQLEDGLFRVRFAPLTRTCPSTVLEALQGLRAALEMHSGLVTAGPLSDRLHRERRVEQRALLDGLRYLDELEPRRTAHGTEVSLPSGHTIRLTFHGACWKIDEVT